MPQYLPAIFFIIANALVNEEVSIPETIKRILENVWLSSANPKEQSRPGLVIGGESGRRPT
jgi:hypothetical protein